MKKKEIYEYIKKAAQGQNEAVAADGGSLVDKPTVDVISPNFMLGTVYSRCRVANIENGNGITLPRYNTGVVSDAGFWGARAFWVEEGENIDKSKITFTSTVLELQKLAVKIPVTNEIWEDAFMLPQYINDVGGEAIRYQIDRAIIYGNQNFAIGGIVGTRDEATVYVTFDTNYKTTLPQFRDAYYGGEDGVWLMGNDIWNTIYDEFTTDASSSVPIEFDADGKALIYGYPVMVVPAMNADGIVLGDFSQFQVIQKELRKDISEHILFDSDQSVCRLTARLQGAPIWSSTTTIENGDIIAPFVALASMEGEEESSEEWNESSSSSSSSEQFSSSSSSEGLSSSSSEGLSSSSSEGFSSSSSSSGV